MSGQSRRRAGRIGRGFCGALCAVAVAAASGHAEAQDSFSPAGRENARVSAEKMGHALLAYWRTRTAMLADRSALNICGTQYRSAVPLDERAPGRVAEIVGGDRLEPCSSRPSPGTGRFATTIVIDSIALILTSATVFSHVIRGRDRHDEVARLVITRTGPRTDWIADWVVDVIELRRRSREQR